MTDQVPMILDWFGDDHGLFTNTHKPDGKIGFFGKKKMII